MDFLPAQESGLFIKIFRLYTWYLFKRRFSRVWLKQAYHPDNQSKTIFYLNHHSWWDGLIPLLLNEYRFQQKARAMMEDKQMIKHPFFRKLGAFSIGREDKRHSLTALRYALQSFERPNASLYIYPEGTITPPGSTMQFEGGLAWLSQKLPCVDIVPIGIYIHTIRRDKPELHLEVGAPIRTDRSLSNREQTHHFEQTLECILSNLRQKAGFDDSPFERLL